MPVITGSVTCTGGAPTGDWSELDGCISPGGYRLVGRQVTTLGDYALTLEWCEARPMKVISATCRVYRRRSSTPSYQSLVHTWIVKETLFPFVRAGSAVICPAPWGEHVVYTVNIELVTPDDGLFAVERRIAGLEQQVADLDLVCSTRTTTAAHFTTLALDQAQNDVCLDFRQLGRQLWTIEASLYQISPHFKDILSSEFVEGTSTVVNPSSEPAEHDTYAFEDSDAETDAASLTSSRQKGQQKPLAPFKRIPIRDIPYSTYLAVIVWAQSRHITFAPLLSTFRRPGLDEPSVGAARQDAVRALALTRSPLLPFPASPKSVYRLADYLSLDDLKQLALDNLVSQLTPTNAIYELYSDVACAYDEVRDAVLEYVVEDWSKVEQAPATSEMASVDKELPVGAARTAMLLATRLGRVKR
ncbi:hypothetical protein JCM3775_002727 [Rhodotorula graminis]